MGLPQMRRDVKITVKGLDISRKEVLISNGMNCKWFAPPTACVCTLNQLGGLIKRVGPVLPTALRLDRATVRAVTDNTIREWGLPVLSPLENYDIETWLAHTSYNEARKESLRACWREVQYCLNTIGSDSLARRKDFWINTFAKAESYEVPKHVRLINARSDYIKVLIGPYIKAMENHVYKRKEFIKHVPVPDRPAYIKKMLSVPGVTVVATDYTSFESHFSRSTMEDIEFRLYDHMLSKAPNYEQIRSIFYDVIAGRNKCTSKYYDFELDATRMSGEMTTSLGNGFSNFIMMKYACQVKGSTMIGVVEGDDGLFIIDGDAPTSADFAELGYNIKLDVHQRYNEASFCGLIFDEDDLINVTDPRKLISEFGWCNRNYVNVKKSRLLELLRAKALSFAHMYNGCPIVTALARCAIRNTKHIDMSKFLSRHGHNEWMIDRYVAAMATPLIYKEVPLSTRLMVERKYNITVQDQISLETYLDSLSSITELDHVVIDRICPVEHAMFNNHFSARRGEDFKEQFPQYNFELSPYLDNFRFVGAAAQQGLRYVIAHV